MSKMTLEDIAFERRETYKGDKQGIPIVGLEHITPEEIELESWDTNTENTFSKKFCKGDVLFGRRRAYLKKAALAPFDGICSGDITVITPNSKTIIPELLPYVIQNDALFEYAVGQSAGSLSPRVKWEHLKKFELEIPESFDEQREMYELLQALQNEQNSCKRALATARRMRASYLDDIYSCHVRIKRDNGLDYPDWKVVKLSDFTEKVSRKNSESVTDLVLTISAADGLVDQREYFNKSVAGKDLRGYFLLQKGEFAYNKSYSIGNPLGSIKRLDGYEQGLLSNLYICFSLDDSYVSDYIKYYFESTCWYDVVYKIVEEGARAHGLLNVGKGAFFATEHKLSTNKEEQEKIVTNIKLMDEHISDLSYKLEAIIKFKKAILMEKISVKK